jgi:hypothetical protein
MDATVFAMHRRHIPMKRTLAAFAATLAALLALGCIAVERQPAKAPAEARFVILDEGRMKFDTQTGQAWRRDGDSWILMKDTEERTPVDANKDLAVCHQLTEVRMPINDIRRTAEFRRLSTADKLRVYRQYFREVQLWSHTAKDSPALAEFYAALHEDLGLVK